MAGFGKGLSAEYSDLQQATMDSVESMLFDDYNDGMVNGDKTEKIYKSKNLAAERRRRKKLNSKLFILRSLVPNITKGKVDFFRIGKNKYHVKILCKKTTGNFTKLLEAIAKYGFDIAEISSFDFAAFTQTACCIEVKEANEVSVVEMKRFLMAIVGASDEN